MGPERLGSQGLGWTPGVDNRETGESFWNSDDIPPQWIEVDLGAPMDILQVRLAIAQHPEGTTVRRILGRTDGEANRLSHDFAGLTKDGQVLDYAPLAPVRAVRYLRIKTMSSVSCWLLENRGWCLNVAVYCWAAAAGLLFVFLLIVAALARAGAWFFRRTSTACQVTGVSGRLS